MEDASQLEKALFGWFSRRSDLVALASPFIIFFFLLALGGAVIALAIRPWPGAQWVSWFVFVVTLAGIGLYLTTLMALGALFTRSRRFRLLELHQTMRDIQAMSWREFEDLVVAYYGNLGYQVDHTGRDAADGGVDVVLAKGGRRWLVQCKHYRSQWIEEKPLRELLGLVTSRKASGGIFVACGVFDDAALAFAKANPNLQLVGGEQLRDLIGDAVARGRTGATDECPLCGAPTRVARGRFGEFLGCANFPTCRWWARLPEHAARIS
jgi:restriction system protein